MPDASEVISDRPWTPTSVSLVSIIGAGLVALVVYICLDLTRFLFAVGFLSVLVALGAWSSYRLRRLAASRPNQSVCTFARDFDRHAVDPWIVRAVWEQLQEYVGTQRGPFPIRAGDQLGREYGMDPDDINDVWEVVARRAGRSVEATDQNPYYDRVRTVGDLVHFANGQPQSGAV